MFALTLQGGLARSISPDVCEVPAPQVGPVPTPLVNQFQLSMADPATACQKIFMAGAPAAHFQTKVPMSDGDEAGTGGGVASRRFVGPGWLSPASASRKLLLENKPAVAMGAQTLHNGDAAFNTTGLCPLGAQAKVVVGS
jgi:hypothetical protein